MLQTVHVLYLV